VEFSKLWIWRILKDKLPWYYKVSINEAPAKYLIALRVGIEEDPGSLSEEELWGIHEELTEEFLELWGKVKEGKVDIRRMPRRCFSLLDINVELVKRILRNCRFCRWYCRVDRAGNKLGACQLDTVSRVASYFHHPGEELVFRGTMGSGTVFFTSCNMRCAFCQNGDISQDRLNGVPMNPRQLAAIAALLRLEGVHNINWVGGEPTIHLHNIVEAIAILAKEGLGVLKSLSDEELATMLSTKADPLYRFDKAQAMYGDEFNVPMLWNSNFFMSMESMRILRTVIDVWLPDFKFGNNKCAIKLSRTPWYFETVSRNHKLIYEWGEDVVIRHLVMPNHVECCTKPVLKWIADNMPNALVNIMDQYHPDNYCDPNSPKFRQEYWELARRPSRDELMEAYRYAKELGLNFEVISFEKRISYGMILPRP